VQFDHASRRVAVRASLAEQGVPLPLIVTDLANVRWLSGFSGSNAVLVLGGTPADDLLGTDGRYRDQAAAESPDLPLLIDRDTLVSVLGRLTAQGAEGPIAVEAGLSMAELAHVQRLFGEPVIAPPVVEAARAIKEADEQALLERACGITAAAFEDLAAGIRVGDTEVGLARRLESLFADHGAHDRAFATIVGTGPHSAIPHHQPLPVALAEGDLLVIDAGALVDGYHADMTRTFVVGREAELWQRDLHAGVLAAQQAAVAACLVGAEFVGVDALARAHLREAGLEEHFTHGLGHGVGLRIHEAPGLGARATGTIRANMAFTVEPGAYLPGRGGVRIEDTLVVTDAGPRVLTEAPRGLRVVGV